MPEENIPEEVILENQESISQDEVVAVITAGLPATPMGVVYEETTTQNFKFIFPSEIRNIKYSFVEVKVNYLDDKNENQEYRIIGRVVDIRTNNPLLSAETMKFFVDKTGLGLDISKYFKSERFMFYVAECEVLGEIDSGVINPLKKPVQSGAEVYTLDAATLESLYFNPKKYWIYPGFIETPNESVQAKFALNGDELLTMHCGIFGMTGMGKTTTTGTVLEELNFRGTKGFIFDPHGDYINLGILNLSDEQLSVFSEKLDANSNTIIEQYKDYLIAQWTTCLTQMSENNNQRQILLNESEITVTGLNRSIIEEMRNELEPVSIIYRLIGYCSLFEKWVPDIKNPEMLGQKLNEFLSNFTSFTNMYQTLSIPEELLWRLIKLNIEAYPSLIINRNSDRFFIIDLIEAYSGENITEAQMPFYDNTLDEIIGNYISAFNNTQNDLEIRDTALVDELLRRAERLDRENRSRGPILRHLNKTRNSLRSLSHLMSFDTLAFVNQFAIRRNNYSYISNIIFDLSGITSVSVQRGLMFSVFDIAFDKYKSREIDITSNGHPLLFVLEEARILIPKMNEDDRVHPATMAAIRSTRRIATEGRKMGLGLLIISQKPSAVDNLPISQCNTLILHRVINPDDLNFVRTVGEAISEEDLSTLKIVGRGVSLVSGTALQLRKTFLAKFRMRLSQEGREQPTPLRDIWGDE